MIKINDELVGKIHFNAGGSAYLVSPEIPKDIYIHKKNTNKSLHLDTVKIKVVKGHGRSIEGEVIEIVERFRTEFVGTLEISPRYAFFIPDSNRLNVDFYYLKTFSLTSWMFNSSEFCSNYWVCCFLSLSFSMFNYLTYSMYFS